MSQRGGPLFEDVQRHREAVFAFVSREYRETGVSPSVREVANHVGIQLSPAHAHLRRLVQLGRLRYSRGKYVPLDELRRARAFEHEPDGIEFCAECERLRQDTGLTGTENPVARLLHASLKVRAHIRQDDSHGVNDACFAQFDAAIEGIR